MKPVIRHVYLLFLYLYSLLFYEGEPLLRRHWNNRVNLIFLHVKFFLTFYCKNSNSKDLGCDEIDRSSLMRLSAKLFIDHLLAAYSVRCSNSGGDQRIPYTTGFSLPSMNTLRRWRNICVWINTESFLRDDRQFTWTRSSTICSEKVAVVVVIDICV